MTSRKPLFDSRHLRKPTTSKAPKQGFTRIEVILMIGVIVIFAVVLILPALPHRHHNPRWLLCFNRLKQIALSEISYINRAESDKP